LELLLLGLLNLYFLALVNNLVSLFVVFVVVVLVFFVDHLLLLELLVVDVGLHLLAIWLFFGILLSLVI
jgi:hypothetical protein